MNYSKKLKILSFIFMILLMHIATNAQTLDWVDHFEGSGPFVSGTSAFHGGLAIDAMGNSYCAGHTSNTLDMDPSAGVVNTTSFGFLAKYDPSGVLLWNVDLVTSGGWLFPLYICDIAVDNNGDVLLYVCLWGQEVDFDPSAGNAIFQANFTGTWDICLVKYDSEGNFIWGKQIGGLRGHPDYPTYTALTGVENKPGECLSVDEDNNYIICGRVRGDADMDPSSNNYPLLGGVQPAQWSNPMANFIAKYDSNGNFLWAKPTMVYSNLANLSNLASLCSEVDQVGNIYLLGTYTDSILPAYPSNVPVYVGTQNVFLAKYDINGNYLWSKDFFANGGLYAPTLSIDSNDDVIISIYSFSTSLDMNQGGTGGLLPTSTTGSGGRTYIGKYDSDGNLLWVNRLEKVGSPGAVEGVSLNTNANNDIYIGGSFVGGGYFYPTQSVPDTSNSRDAFILKYDAGGNYQYHFTVGKEGAGDEYFSRVRNTAYGVTTVGRIKSGQNMDFDPSSGQSMIANADLNNTDLVLARYIDVYQPFTANFIASQDTLCIGDSITFQDLSTGTGIATWDWSFPGGTPSSYSGENPPSISYSMPGQYDVALSIVGTEGNMHDTTFVNYITVPSAINITGDITNLQCYEDSSGEIDITVEGGSGAYSYNWSELSTTEDLEGLGIGTYFVTVTDQTNCIATESFTLTQPEEISVSIETTHILCYGDANGEAHITVSGGNPEYIFSWSNGIQTSTDVYGLVAGHYDITVTDGNNCKVYESIEITQPNQLTVSLPDDFYMCDLTEETIYSSTTGGVADYTYSWNSSHTTRDIVVSPHETTDYSVTVTDANNCTSIAQITVGVYSPLSFLVSASDENICQGESVTIEGIFNGGAGEPYFVYHNNEEITLPYTLSPQFTQAFEFEAKDVCGSIDRQTIEIRVDPLPDFMILSDINYGCQPVEIQFQSISTTNQVFQDFSWSFFEAGDMIIKNTAFPSYNYESSGLFDVQLKATNEFGCSKTKFFGEYITVHPKPKAQFTTMPNQGSELNPTIYFDNNSIHAYENYWDFGDGYSSLLMSPEHRYGAYKNDYEVKLVVRTEFGCSDSLTSTVKIKSDCPFYAPDAFTPVPSSNSNHTFNVFGNCIDPDNFEMLIYDRWGEIVFEVNRYDNENPLLYGWDGSVKNGEVGSNGVYIWFVRYKNLEEELRYTKTGKVTLIR